MTADVAVVTGGASGFGLALATSCAARGMGVALLDADGARAQAEAAGIASTHGVTALGIDVDVRDADAVQRAVGDVAQEFGRADIVVSNVGVQLFGAVERLTDDEWKWVLDVNVVGSARVARGFLPLLRKSPNGRLAFTTSSSVLSPAGRMAAYQASKFAVWGLAETIRLEVEGDGVGVSVIFPSGMLSRHLETSQAVQPEQWSRPIGEPGDFEAMRASNPGMVADLATPEEAASGVVAAILAGERYIVTHGHLVTAIDERNAALRRAALAVGG